MNAEDVLHWMKKYNLVLSENIKLKTENLYLKKELYLYKADKDLTQHGKTS